MIVIGLIELLKWKRRSPAGRKKVRERQDPSQGAERRMNLKKGCLFHVSHVRELLSKERQMDRSMGVIRRMAAATHNELISCSNHS